MNVRIIDAQIHVWEDDKATRRWDPEYRQSRSAFLDFGDAVTGSRAVAAMDAVGVDVAAITTFLLYDDIDYAVESYLRYPDRFLIVPQIDLRSPDPEGLLRRFARQTELSAARISFLTENGEDHYRRFDVGDFDPLIHAATDLGLPVMLVVSGSPLRALPVIQRNRETTFVIDHLGIVQGPHRVRPADPFAGLDDVLRVASEDNVVVKLSGLPTLSAEPYPHTDLAGPVRRTVDALGTGKIMWGSDFTRTRPMHCYADALGYLRNTDILDQAEKTQILGGTASEVLRWPSTPHRLAPEK